LGSVVYALYSSRTRYEPVVLGRACSFGPKHPRPLHCGRRPATPPYLGFREGDVVIRIGIGYRIPRVNRKSPRVLVRHFVPQGIGNGAPAICRLLLPEAGRGFRGKVSALRRLLVACSTPPATSWASVLVSLDFLVQALLSSVYQLELLGYSGAGRLLN
jgi:hypothetical protein